MDTMTTTDSRWERSSAGGTHYVPRGERTVSADHLIDGGIALCGVITSGHGSYADEVRIRDLHRVCDECLDRLIELNTEGTP